MTFPKISIITPSYNQADFLEETILSVINQNYPNLEYIIIDGGSTDNSVEIIKKYEEHLKYWISEKDYGQSHAINKGFAKATGEILNWINSDDILCENALINIAIAYNKTKNNQFIIAGQGYEIDEKSKLLCERKVYYNDNSSSVFQLNIKGNPIQQAIFFSRILFYESGGINPFSKFSMDIDLYQKFSLFSPEIIIVEDYLASFRKHSNSKTIFQDYKMLLEKINLLNYISFYNKNTISTKSQISAYVTSFPFNTISLTQRLKLFYIFLKNTPFNKNTRYKYKIILKKLITQK
jgi:glycosyltransferase involved in cell wall biosynthesis